eukprot:m.285683 g.285683  ORF g.285683 m.285683 type:complete len:90 (-) comp27038_c0_seq14:84-353(-)
MAVNPTNTELHFLVPQPRVALDTVRDPVHVQVHSVIVTYTELHILPWRICTVLSDWSICQSLAESLYGMRPNHLHNKWSVYPATTKKRI